MMIISIAVSTMVIVAIAVIAIQYREFKKEYAKRGKSNVGKGTVGGAQEAPLAS